MFFSRSHRLWLLLAGLAGALAGAAAAVGVWGPRWGAIPPSAGALAMAGATAWLLWTTSRRRLGFFRDRMVVISEAGERHARWQAVEVCLLTDPDALLGADWPRLALTDVLTLCLRGGGRVRLRPAEFGLDPGGCWDLVLRLREDRRLRERLPSYRPGRPAARTIVRREPITPRL